MRVAALYDIHGNLPALEAVLDEISREAVDQIVVGGDIVPGPMPRECLRALAQLRIPVHYIRGNCEVAVVAAMEGRDAYPLPEPARATIQWSARELRSDCEAVFRSWPKTVSVEVAGLGKVLFCHATPRDENEIFTALTPEDRLRAVFSGLDAAVVVCGHTHIQFDRPVGSIRVVNAGSVGMPFCAPGAYWLLLGHDLELRRTEYDLTAAAKRIRESNYIQAEEFAERYVLHPPSEEEMLALLSRAELK